jgi:hypothetical protein
MIVGVAIDSKDLPTPGPVNGNAGRTRSAQSGVRDHASQ